MDKERAKKYAIDAFLWLAKENQHLNSFLRYSGANAYDLRVRSKDPEFLSFVMDFFMTSDELILRFSKDLNCSPETIQRASYILSSRDLPNWT